MGISSAFKDRGQSGQRLQREPDGPESCEISLELNLPTGRHASYTLMGGPRHPDLPFTAAWWITREAVQIHEGETEESPVSSHFEVIGNKIGKRSWNQEMLVPHVMPDRPYLTFAGALPEFRDILDALRTLAFYDFDAKGMRPSLMATSPSASLLGTNGADLPGVLARLLKNEPKVKERLEGYLSTIVPDFEKIEIITSSFNTIYLQFHQGVRKPVKHVDENGKVRLHYVIDPAMRRDFLAASMSDGTLRALGVLTAAFQAADKTVPVRLVGIEEPEISVHPAAAAGLVGALEEASYAYTQIIATTQRRMYSTRSTTNCSGPTFAFSPSR